MTRRAAVVRKPVAAVPAVALPDTTTLYGWVVCDDGALFMRDHDSGIWREMTPVPGTKRAAERAGGAE